MRPEADPTTAESHAAQIDDLLSTYAAVVDGQEWTRWPDLFGDDGSYAVYSLENLERGLPLAYMLDDSPARLRDRVKFLTEVWVGTVEPYRTRHMLQRLSTERRGDGTYAVRSNLVVAYTETDSAPALLACGQYEDVIRVTDDGPRFSEKKVLLDGTPARYLVYPL